MKAISQVLSVVDEFGVVTSADVADELGISLHVASAHLSELADQGLIKRTIAAWPKMEKRRGPAYNRYESTVAA